MFSIYNWYWRRLKTLIHGAHSSTLFSVMFSLINRYWRSLRSLIRGADSDSDSDFSTQMVSIIPSPFDRLPYDVVGKIFGNLCTGDRIRVRLVCKAWRERLMRADFALKPEAPWLIFSNDSYNLEYCLTEICFKSLFEERIYRFKLPNSFSGGMWRWRWRWCCCGSSRGWLLMAGRAGPDLSSTVMWLWDPISGTTRKLPALSTLPFFSKLVEIGISVGLEDISSFVARAQVFSVGSVECVVAVLFAFSRNLNHQLAMCSPQDQSWSVVGGGEKYNDILSHNGKLYASCVYSINNGMSLSSVIEKANYAIRLSCCDVEVILLQLVCDEDVHVSDGPLYPVGFSVRERWTLVEYLVESSSELLVVSAILDLCSYINSGDQRPIQSFACSQTRGFEVRRLNINNNGSLSLCCLEKVSHIGNKGIFVGPVGSTSVDGVEANCIHFATNSGGRIGLGRGAAGYDINALHDDQVDGEEEEEHDRVNHEEIEFDPNTYIVRERGVFYLQQNEINRTSLTNLLITTPSVVTGWFTPKLG